MKKNVLTLSITAALVGLGFAGGAQAIGLLNTTSNPIATAAGTRLNVSVDGIGQMLLVPYYTVQSGNTTMINIVNTDTVNGKAVKVRFRGAANSDDVFDFQVFLSPSDVWTASVSQDAAGQARLTVSTNPATPETTCTKPTKTALNATPFSTVRVDPNRTAEGKLNETREGYVELFNMADIPPLNGTATNALYTAIKHSDTTFQPPCYTTPTNAAWVALDTDPLNETVAHTKGLYAPTSGLMANWIILNALDAGAWSGAATAINAQDAQFNIVPGPVVYFPQTDAKLLDLITATRVATFTADPVLIAHPSMMRVYDLPDFSIPYSNSNLPADQVVRLSDALATRSITNEFLTYSAIHATTDWVLSMPTRRYSAAFDYTTAVDDAIYTSLSTPYFTADNITVIDRQLCVNTASIAAWNQEEFAGTPTNPGVIISPQPEGASPDAFTICGEASVLSFNHGEAAGSSGLITTQSGTLMATVARSAIENGYVAGWARLTTPGVTTSSTTGLPILGYEAIRALGTSAATFGATLPHRTDRVLKF